MRYHAHFGELPLEGFKHCGDRKIKPQGGGGIVGDIIGGAGDLVSGAGDLIGGAVDTLGNTVEGIGNTVGAFVENPVKFTENLGKNLLENPEKAAMLAAAFYAPTLLANIAPEVAAELAMSADFAATDAASLASQGLTESQIAETLAASGMDSFVAADAASLASQGLSQQAIAQNLANSGLQAYQVNQASTLPVIGDQAGDYPTGEAGVWGRADKADVQKLLDYNAAYGATPALTDTLKLANQAKNLLSPTIPTQNPQNVQQQASQAGYGVDYSGLLGLLQQKANRPDILNLLG